MDICLIISTSTHSKPLHALPENNSTELGLLHSVEYVLGLQAISVRILYDGRR